MVSFLLLTAACVTGAVDPPAAGCNCNNPAPQGNVTYFETGPAPGGLRYRLRNFLGMHPQPSPYAVVSTGQPVPTTGTVYQTDAPPVAVAQTAPPPEGTTTVTGYRPNLQVPEKHRDKVGHETDYSWITGQLFYVRADGGRWLLRYGHPDEVDKYGGSVVLAPTVEMRNFREGDLICVYGQVIEDGRASRSLGGPLYRTNSISMVERADP